MREVVAETFHMRGTKQNSVLLVWVYNPANPADQQSNGPVQSWSAFQRYADKDKKLL